MVEKHIMSQYSSDRTCTNAFGFAAAVKITFW